MSAEVRAGRPVKRREAARVIIRCGGRVLLMQDSDPGVPGAQWWVVPGGGIDPGETVKQAAVREVAEETGYQASEADLVGPVAVRDVVHGYSDKVLYQRETFYVLDVDQPFDVDTSGFTDEEKRKMQGWGWFTADDLAGMEVWPESVVDVMGSDGSRCVDWGVMQESTVPVEAG